MWLNSVLDSNFFNVSCLKEYIGLHRCNLSFKQLHPSGLRMTNQIYLYKNKLFIMVMTRLKDHDQNYFLHSISCYN